MSYTIPPILPTWGQSNTTSADMVQPSNAYIQAGWPLSATPPPRQYFNWLFNFLANVVAYFMQRGLPDWVSTATYQQNSRCIGDDGNTYLSLINNNTGNTPSTSPSQWQLWGLTIAQVDAATLTQATATTGDSSTKVANTAFVQNTVGPLSSEIATLNGEVSTLNSEMATADGNISTLQGQVGTINGEISTIDGTLTSLEGDITNLQGQINTTNANLSSFEGEFGSSVAVNGYQKLPSGLILMWGTGSSGGSGNSQPVYFPIAFPNAVFTINITAHYTSGQNTSVYMPLDGSITVNGFTLVVPSNSDMDGYSNFAWFAIGH